MPKTGNNYQARFIEQLRRKHTNLWCVYLPSVRAKLARIVLWDAPRLTLSLYAGPTLQSHSEGLQLSHFYQLIVLKRGAVCRRIRLIAVFPDETFAPPAPDDEVSSSRRLSATQAVVYMVWRPS